jgi:hypothetical protein
MTNKYKQKIKEVKKKHRVSFLTKRYKERQSKPTYVAKQNLNYAHRLFLFQKCVNIFS